MKIQFETNEEIRRRGLKALLRDLGPEGLIRFLRLIGAGSGDYTKDRADSFPDGDLESLLLDLPLKRRGSPEF